MSPSVKVHLRGRNIDLDKLTKVETDVGYTYVIGIEDIIFDRIQAAEHWKSESDKEQAIRVASLFWDEIDWKYIRRKCAEEGSEKMLKDVKERARRARDKIK